jgi:hypothetical protein
MFCFQIQLAPLQLGGDHSGWLEQLQDFLGASARGTEVVSRPAGGGGPWAPWSLHQAAPRLFSPERYGGLFAPAPGPATALSARRVNDDELVISIPTACAGGGGAPHPRVVSCSFSGYHPVHRLHLRLARGGLRVPEVVMVPADFPHVDLVGRCNFSR